MLEIGSLWAWALILTTSVPSMVNGRNRSSHYGRNTRVGFVVWGLVLLSAPLMFSVLVFHFVNKITSGTSKRRNTTVHVKV